MIDPHRRNVGVACGTLLASGATLVCCVLPALLVSIGARATLVGLVSAFPQLVWLSERKIWVFGSAVEEVLGHARFHKGVDLRAVAGTPIVAAADGRVSSAGWHGGYGNQVRITHANGIQTTYGHMSRIAARAGEAVRRGQVIGYVGSTGLSTGPHLHYEVYKNGRPVNPLSVKMASGPAQLEGAKLHAFHDELRKLLLLPSAG